MQAKTKISDCLNGEKLCQLNPLSKATFIESESGSIPTPPLYWMPLTGSLMFVYICIDVGDPVEGRCWDAINR